MADGDLTGPADRVTAACAGLAEVTEVDAWAGLRWEVRGRTFAHLLPIVDGHPPVYARAAGTSGIALTFWSAGPELHTLRGQGHPFFAVPWNPAVVGLLLDRHDDAVELRELLVDSYRIRAPARLRPPAT